MRKEELDTGTVLLLRDLLVSASVGLVAGLFVVVILWP